MYINSDYTSPPLIHVYIYINIIKSFEVSVDVVDVVDIIWKGEGSVDRRKGGISIVRQNLSDEKHETKDNKRKEK
jgi:hypothetical protein